MEIAEVKAFNAELSALYENRPPISKAKMGAITRGAIKAIKFYKHVVHSVEKFIQKCKSEYKIPGLYVIDSIVRQSRHQFGADKDVFAPRFAKNMQNTFANLLRCPPEDKRNIIRVLNLWQKNNVFGPDVIQPLFDMADPNHPIHQELLAQQPQHTNGSLNLANPESKSSPSLATQHTPTITPNQEQMRGHDSAPSTNTPQQNQVNFNRRLLNMDFEYESEDDGGAADSSPPSRGPISLPIQSQQPLAPVQNPQLSNSFLMNPLSNLQSLNPQDTIGSILTNPEILRHIHSLQTQLFVPNFPLQANNVNMSQDMNYVDTSQPPPLLLKPEELNNARSTSPLLDEVNNESDIEFVDDAGPQVIEIDGNDSRSPSPKSSRRRRSRSRDRSRRSRSRSRRSRSRSRDRRRRSRDRSRDRNIREKPRDKERDKEREKEREREREKERERRKKGLPPIKKDTLSVCSTTLWVGHLSKLVQAEELSDAFGAFGDVISIDLVPPRGCAFIVMNRRRDASRAIAKLNKQKMHGKAITVAWAPGKGVKGREWKDFWEAEAGACYIPWLRLPTSPTDGGGLAVLQALEEGGVMDEETLPAWLQPKALTADIKPKPMTDISAVSTGLLSSNAPGMMVMSPLAPPQGLGVDTSCLPPPLGPLGYAPHPALSMPLPLLGFKPSPQPGLQALHLQAVLAHQQQQQLATQMLLGPPPRLPPHPLSAIGTPLQSSLSMVDSRQDDAMELDTGDDHVELLQSLSETTKKLIENDSQISEKLKALVSNPPPSFSIPPPLLPRQGLLGKPPLLPNQNFSVTSQPPPSFNITGNDQNTIQNNLQNINDRDKDKRDRDGGRKDRERRDRDRDRDRPRDRHERERDRERDRDRDRDRSERERGDRDRGVEKDRDRNEKDRDRDRERGRERSNRWGGRDQRGSSRDRSPGGAGRHGGTIPNVNNERSLQDRLWEMANGPGPRPQRGDSPPRSSRNDRSLKDSHNADSLLGDGPTEMDRRKGPHSSRSLSPSGIMGPNGPIGLNNSLGPNGPMGPSGPMGPNGPIGPIGGMLGPNISMMGRSPLPPMAPFRIGRDEMRMRSMGPRGPLLRPGLWVDGPGQFGPRFNGGPPFNRAPFDGLPYERAYDGPPYDRSPFDRSHFDGPGRPPFDGPHFEGGPIYDGPPDNYYDRNDRNGPRGPRGIRGSEGRRPRERDAEGRERPNRSSRWAECDSPEKVVNKTEISNETKNPSEVESEPKQDSSSPRIPVDSSDTQDNASPNSNILPTTDHATEESNEPVNTESVNELENTVCRMTPEVNDNIDTNENSTSNQDIFEENQKNQTEAPLESNESLENEGTDEGRGTPCRDEPVNNTTTTPDLTDP